MDRYQIGDHLGAGGQALVTKATDLVLGRFVAIKSLQPYFGAPVDDRDRERLRREARALATLSHPSIPAVYDVDVESSPPVIVFEFIDGDNLITVLSRRRPTVREVCRWILQAAGALSHAHSQGVIHRDVKPANMILRKDDGTCCLVDFGLATLPGDSLRTSSKFFGTPGYMSPEQLRGEEVDARADVYSLAVTMYQLLANKLPAPEEYESLKELDPAIPLKLDELLQNSMRARTSRPATVAEFARQLKDSVSVSVSMSDLVDNAKLLGILAERVSGVEQGSNEELMQQLRLTQERLLKVHGLVEDGLVSLSDLGIRSGANAAGLLIPLTEAVKKFRRDYILETLDRCGGNRTQAARALGVDVRTIFRYLAAEED